MSTDAMNNVDEGDAKVAEGVAIFSAELFPELSALNADDLVYSPFSLSSALAVTSLAAGGSTAEEITQNLHFPGNANNENVKLVYSQILESLKETPEDLEFYSATKLCLPNRHDSKLVNLNKDFSKRIQDNLGTDVQQVNYTDTSALTTELNAWVDSRTNGKISKLLSENLSPANTEIALLNGIYFKGEWKYKFDERSTRESEFHLNDEETFLVDMMHVRDDKIPYQVYEDLDAQAVTLPFRGDRLSMVVYVPLKIDGLATIEKTLRKLATKGVSSRKYIPKYECRVRVYLPRFRIESCLQFVGPLQQIGFNTMFKKGEANFEGMLERSGQVSLCVSHVLQRTVVEVDEGGSSKAPPRSLSSNSSFGSDHRKPTTSYFIADRPFLFHIVENSTSMVVFAGKCVKPEFDYKRH